MPTPAFLASYKKAQKRNKMLSYEQKRGIWKFCVRDWDNGTGKRVHYKPFPAAEKIHRSLARFVVMACGNRFAKSLIAGMEATANMMVPGTKTWILGSQYAVCDHEFDYVSHNITKTKLWDEYVVPKMRKMCDKEGIKYKKDENFHSRMRQLNNRPKSITIDWPGASPSVIEQRSYETSWAQLEGAKVSMIIFAEGSKIPRRLWDRHLKKRLSDMYGRVIIPATPKGRDTFLYPAFLKGLSERMFVDVDRNQCEVKHYYRPVQKSQYHVDNAKSYSESYESFQYPGFENPYYNVDDYDAEVRELFDGNLDASVFKERNFGTFESLSGNFFMGIDEKKCFVDSFELPENVTHYRAIDPGRANQACCLWIAVQPWEGDRYRYIVYNELYQSGLYLEKFIDILKRMTIHPVEFTVPDPVVNRQSFNNKRTVFQRIEELGVPLRIPVGLPRTSVDRFNIWLPDIKDGRVVIFKDKCPNFREEILACEYAPPIEKDGHTVYDEKLANTPQNALDSFTYFRWVKPKYIQRNAQKQEVTELPAQPLSVKYVLKQRAGIGSGGMLELLKG